MISSFPLKSDKSLDVINESPTFRGVSHSKNENGQQFKAVLQSLSQLGTMATILPAPILTGPKTQNEAQGNDSESLSESKFRVPNAASSEAEKEMDELEAIFSFCSSILPKFSHVPSLPASELASSQVIPIVQLNFSDLGSRAHDSANSVFPPRHIETELEMAPNLTEKKSISTDNAFELGYRTSSFKKPMQEVPEIDELSKTRKVRDDQKDSTAKPVIEFGDQARLRVEKGSPPLQALTVPLSPAREILTKSIQATPVPILGLPQQTLPVAGAKSLGAQFQSTSTDFDPETKHLIRTEVVPLRPEGSAPTSFPSITASHKSSIVPNLGPSLGTEMFSQLLADGSLPIEVADSLSLSSSVQNTTVTTGSVSGQLPHTRQIAAQIAVAVSNSGGSTTELLLSPEELGRVRITMSSNEGSMSVAIIAERPETADLMRRHIDQLSQDFKALGYNDLRFSFGSNSGSASSEGNPDQLQGTLVSTDRQKSGDLQNSEAPAQLHVGKAGLDVRL